VPEAVREKMTFVLAECVEDVVRAALTREPLATEMANDWDPAEPDTAPENEAVTA